MQAFIWGLKCLLSMLTSILGQYKHLHFSILSDLKKTTVVVESLSTIQPDVLFQRLPAYFKIDPTELEIYIK